MSRYYPKRPVRSFQDLTVYQKTYNLAIKIVKNITAAEIDRTSGKPGHQSPETAAEVVKTINNKLLTTLLEIPVLIATAHSLRFGDPQQAVASLEQAMLDCNLAVVYLEQYRDLCNSPAPTAKNTSEVKNKDTSEVKDGTEPAFFEEQIKEYLRVRGKIMRLQKSWLKFVDKK